MSNTQVHAGSGGGDEPEDEGGQVQAEVASIDDLLDQIDSVLENNAESFVQGFVQKGGQ
ncbi:ubiquitin-like protein Pup [Actinomyces polynesiensis]|uniref:ubiquitin-like protein Pup n=1 Tax=Actinomyces polynesiensis TaxID=1325934 RepID=UPI00093D3D2F|nr:ubiquitin-like protein Pup [Actinomyces polynesiensis]